MRQLEHLRPDHDETLVARLAADDLAGREADAAGMLVAECPGCAELLADLQAIASATAALPATRRPRDFRLTEADAAHLRPAGWQRLLRRFGEPGLSFTRPLAMGLTTLGIAGLLLTTLPGGFGFGSGAASTLSTVGSRVTSPQEAGGTYYEAASSPAIVMAPSAAASAAASSPTSGDVGGATKSSGTPDQGAQALTASPTPAEFAAPGPAAIMPQTDAGGGPSPLFVVSVVVLVAGLGLGGLRLAARRLA